MKPEIDLYGVFIPTFAALALAAYLLSLILRNLLHRIGFYKLVWHRPLFDMALLVCILAGLVSAIDKVTI